MLSRAQHSNLSLSSPRSQGRILTPLMNSVELSQQFGNGQTLEASVFTSKATVGNSDVVREMTTRFGNDFNSALNQPALFPSKDAGDTLLYVHQLDPACFFMSKKSRLRPRRARFRAEHKQTPNHFK